MLLRIGLDGAPIRPPLPVVVLPSGTHPPACELSVAASVSRRAGAFVTLLGARAAAPPQLESEVGAPLVLLLRSRDRFGNAQSGGGDAWEARLVGGEAGADTEPPSVADHGDGTYALTLLSRSAGLFSLEVRLCSAGRLYAPFTCIFKCVDSRACDRLFVPN